MPTIKQTDSNAVSIHGNIARIDEYDDLRHIVLPMVELGAKSLHFHFEGTLLLSSSALGFLLRLVRQDKIEINFYIDNPEFDHFIQNMHLHQHFKIHQSF